MTESHAVHDHRGNDKATAAFCLRRDDLKMGRRKRGWSPGISALS